MQAITLRGVEVHNLKKIDLDLPLRELIVFCGVSGSGKTSLAIDTLYAESQRRYIESFSPYTRQFLEQLPQPAAEKITGIPASIAVTPRQASRSNRVTVGTATEVAPHLHLLFSKVGVTRCYGCGRVVTSDTTESAADWVAQQAKDARVLVTFAPPRDEDISPEDWGKPLHQEGFRRGIYDGEILPLEEIQRRLSEGESAETSSVEVVVDRFVSGKIQVERLRDSLETAFTHGSGESFIWMEGSEHEGSEQIVMINERPMRRIGFSEEMTCPDCRICYPQIDPGYFNFNSPLGACEACEGFGTIAEVDMDLVVPDKEKTLREGAVAPWNSPAYRHELEELLELADDYEIPVDIPYRELSPQHIDRVVRGVAEREFGGLNGFFSWLERRKYKMPIRVFLSRWKSYRPCTECDGTRLKKGSLATCVANRNIAQICELQITQCREWIAKVIREEEKNQVAKRVLLEIDSRLRYLESVGLGYLSLDRPLRTLSAGEAQRVALTTALGSNLVNMLYVLDEPSIGLHPHDVDPLVQAIVNLRDRSNTVLVVEHEPSVIRAADRIVELGPGAGEQGGELMFQGTPAEIESDAESVTGDYLMLRRGLRSNCERRTTDQGWIRLKGARGNNLKNLDVEFPLGVLCAVTGVSGSGKSSLVQETLYPALCARLKKQTVAGLPYEDIYGAGQLDDCVLLDQQSLGRSPRSNPVTYIKAFDEIRRVFAQSTDARTRNIAASHFSFNVDGGRCPRCKGEGQIEIDMQFLADVYMDCPECGGSRYTSDVLEILYRGKSISDVLGLTVREAFVFFRGETKVQARLKRLLDVGLGYLPLGQGVNTLSGGEAQRLKMAAAMSSRAHKRTLYILDEPTAGLHFADVTQLQDCFTALLDVGHSLLVVDHNLQLIKEADYVIDLGPGAGDAGGQVVASGIPEEVAQHTRQPTGRCLAEVLANEASLRDEVSPHSQES